MSLHQALLPHSPSTTLNLAKPYNMFQEPVVLAPHARANTLPDIHPGTLHYKAKAWQDRGSPADPPQREGPSDGMWDNKIVSVPT